MHPRLRLQKEELRYLQDSGWTILAGTCNEKYCTPPEGGEAIELDVAVLEQKRRDSKNARSNNA